MREDERDELSVWNHAEVRTSTKLREVDCCGGSVDVGSDYRHRLQRVGRDFWVFDEHVDKTDCAFYAHYRSA